MPGYVVNKNKPTNNLKIQLVVILLFLLAFSSLLYALLSFWSQPRNAALFLNPDFSAYTYLAYNLIYEHGSIFSWHLGTAPYFIPEIAVLYLTTLFVKSAYLNLLLYSLFQILFITIIIPAVFKAATNSIAGFRLGIVSVLAFLLLLVIKHPFYMYSNNDYLSAIFAPGFHYGAALLVFSALFLFLKILSNSKVYLKILLFILLVLSGMSDPLTYIYFTAPMFVTLLVFFYVKKLPKKDYIILSLLLVIAVIVAYTIYHLLPIQYVQIKAKPSFQTLYVLAFFKTIFYFIQQNIILGLLWLGFIIWAPFSLWQSFIGKYKNNLLVDYIILFIFLTVIISTPLIILAIGQVLPSSYETVSVKLLFLHPSNFYNQLDYFPYRYMINYFIGPIFLGFPLLLYKHTQGLGYIDKVKIYAGILVFFAIMGLLLKPHQLDTKNLFHFQSKLSLCLQQYAKKYNLTNGISDNYWASNVLTAFDTNGSHIALVNTTNLSPIRWQNTLQVYQYRNYNFAISNTKEIEFALIKRFGAPVKVEECVNKFNTPYYIFIYNNNIMNTIF